MGSPDEYVVIPPEELSNYTEKLYRGRNISSHCMIFARIPETRPQGGRNCTAHGHLSCHGAVMMQMRFDGKLGFPGGLTDEKECPVDAVNREMVEEINLDLTCHKVEAKDYVVTYYNKSKGMVHHCYSLEVTESEFRAIEQRSLLADYGDEVMGILRVPLYTRKDGLTGFPTFLTNKFAGCSYLQLLSCLKKTNLLSAEEIEAAEKIAAKIGNS